MVEMELVEIQITDELGPQIIILREKHGNRHFPIYIGPHEVAILDQTVKGVEPARPLTHDLVLNVLDGLGGRLVGVVVDELRRDTFHGKLLVRGNHGEVERVDTRPSDAIILAMKRSVPIYVEEEVLRATASEEDHDDESRDDDPGSSTDDE